MRLRGKDIAVSASTVSADPTTGRLDPRRWWALAAMSLAAFMAYLDNNIVNVAIPTIQRNLHLSVAGLEWVVSSYLLTLAGLLLVGGRLADVYGRRRLFLLGLAVFTLSSLAAGLAGSGSVLIASRAIQGIGARVVDLRWLAPLPAEDVLHEARATGRVLIVDETRRTGGVSEAIVTALVDAGYRGTISRVTSEDSFVPLGQAADAVLLDEPTIEKAAVDLVHAG